LRAAGSIRVLIATTHSETAAGDIQRQGIAEVGGDTWQRQLVEAELTG
jgi:hypothetical protein